MWKRLSFIRQPSALSENDVQLMRFFMGVEILTKFFHETGLSFHIVFT